MFANHIFKSCHISLNFILGRTLLSTTWGWISSWLSCSSLHWVSLIFSHRLLVREKEEIKPRTTSIRMIMKKTDSQIKPNQYKKIISYLGTRNIIIILSLSLDWLKLCIKAGWTKSSSWYFKVVTKLRLSIKLCFMLLYYTYIIIWI